MAYHSQNKHSDSTGYPKDNSGYSSPKYFNDEKPINWKKYIFLFIRNWYWFLIAAGISLGVGFFKNKYAIQKYEAEAIIIIEEEENSQDMIGQLRSVRYLKRQIDLANEKAKLSSFTLINRTIDSLRHNVSWTAHGRIRVQPLYENPRFKLNIEKDSTDWYKGQDWFIEYIDDIKYRFYQDGFIDTVLYLDSIISISGWHFSLNLTPSESGHSTYSFRVNRKLDIIREFKSKLQIETDEKEGTVIKLRSQGTVGKLEADFLNVLSSVYILSGLERKQKMAENTFVFLDDQIELILDSLRNSETQLITFRLSNNVINLSREGDIAYERLKGFHEQRTRLKLDENYFKYLKEYIEEKNDPSSIISPSLMEANDQLLISSVQEIQELYEERENLDFSATKGNPGLESIDSRIAAVRIRLLEIVKGLVENNKMKLIQLDIEEQAIIDQLKTLPLNEQQLLNIKRKYDLYNQFYTFLLQKRAEAGIQKAATISNARVLDPAQYELIIPLGNDSKVIILVALLIGLLVPSTIILLINLLDNRIREREDITNLTDIPIAGMIGHSKNAFNLPLKDKVNTTFSEALRRIRSNIDFSLRDNERKVILITSSISGEGKTFSAANLASIIAMNNQKVLLIGCDLRKPTLHKIFGLKNDFGITSVVTNEKKLEEVIFETEIKNLSLLPSGPIPPNPAEILETQEIEQIFNKIVLDFDYVIIDSPPIALVADAFSLAEYAGLTLYVVRQNYSHKDVIRIANTVTEEGKLPKSMLLVNDIQGTRSLGMNYYYGYGQGYSYGYYNYKYASEYYTSE